MKETAFNYFKDLYQNNKFDVLLREEGSVYWLKLRSISRKSLMVKFCQIAKIDIASIKSSAMFEHIYHLHPEENIVDDFILNEYQTGRSQRKRNEHKLISELYKMKVFDWGGLYQNNLERTIVDNYVKKIQDFDILNKKIENEIHFSMRGYVQSSWYNHWTSIIIEDIFKDHKKVTPTIGLIKKVDFFIEGIPFDLKVTYFPDGYMFEQRREIGLLTEIQLLKQFAKSVGIKADKQQKKALFSELLTRISESTNPQAKNFIVQFNNARWEIIQKTLRNPKGLIRWLYEEQGERRFDAANRLFLVLIDKNSLEESWKMKRNTDLLESEINKYMDSFNTHQLHEKEIEFDWLDGKKYRAISDVIFVVKE
jgi:hypothetical protein